MKSIIVQVTHNCTLWQLNKVNNAKYGHIFGGSRSETPLEKFSSDIFGPFDLSDFLDDGKGYIITFTDVFSRFTRLSLLKEITGEAISRAFETKWLKYFEPPRIVISDQGRQYTSATFKNTLSKHGIRSRFTSPYNPTANGLSERINSTLGSRLRICKGIEINRAIKSIENGLNFSVNRVTGESPANVLGIPNPFRNPDMSLEEIVNKVRKLNKEFSENSISKLNSKRVKHHYKKG